ncbi:MAG: transporter substrate-binding domain-containing protein [Spirochaetaceae bacterium]|jgi:polar amino acid transport system substrate-binding protein|nr:transporter substrate-binding domain-containing protein [Spirochaetaceae bacterium]
MKKLHVMALACAAVLLVACGPRWRDVDAIKKKGELVLYTDATWPPYEYIGESGKVIGADIDIGYAIADDLGVKLRIINASFDGFSLALQHGQADIAIAAITITPEREEALDFSTPYSNTVQYIVKPASDIGVQNLSDLDGHRIGVQLGTTGDILVSSLVKEGMLKNAEILQFKALQDAMLGLMKGDPFAIVCDEALAKNLVAANPGAAYVPGKTGGEDEFYGVAIVKGNSTLLDAVNKTIDRLMKSGEIEKRIAFHRENSALYADENGQ